MILRCPKASSFISAFQKVMRSLTSPPPSAVIIIGTFLCAYTVYTGGFLRALAQRSSKPCAADLFPHTCNRAHACFSPRFISGIFSALIGSSGFIYAINLRSQQTHCAIVVDRPEHAHARQFCLPLLASIPMPIFAYVYQAPLLLCPAMVTGILIRLRITFKLHVFSFSQSSMFSF